MLLLRMLVITIPLLGATFSASFSTLGMAQTERRSSAQREGAWRLFKQAEYDKARAAFQLILKRQPDDHDARVGVARSVYHLEDWDNALRAFRAVSIQALDPEASYEYGQTMFRSEHYDEALGGFRRVPPGHELRDLAAYFGGVAALRLKSYRDARDLMDSAMRLPEPYRKNRDMYVRHIDILLAREERRRLAGERGEQIKDAPVPVAAYEHRGFYKIDRKAIVGTENKTQIAKYHGRREETNNFSTRYFHFENGVIHPLTPAGEERTVVGLLLELHAEQKDFDGLERSLDRVPDVTARTTEFSKTGIGSALLFTEWTLPRGFWLDLQGAFEQEYPDFGKKLSYSTRSGGAAFGQRKGSYQARIFAQMLETMDAKREVSMTETQYNLEMFGQPLAVMDLAIVGQYSAFDYKRSGIDGPKLRGRLNSEALFKLPLGFALIFQGRYETNTGFLKHGIANLAYASYAKDAARGAAMLFFNPLSWMTIGARVENERQWLRDFDPDQPRAVVDEIKALEASDVLETAMVGELNLFF